MLLRPFEQRDVDAVLAYATDEEWARYLPVPQPYLREHADEFISSQLSTDWTTKPAWAIIKDGVALGGVNVSLQIERRSASIGYSLARPEWGKGLTTEAVHAVIGVAFGSLPDLNRIQAWADERNGASRRVMEKVGMSFEGVLRDRSVVRGELISDAFYSILRSEWERA